MVSSSSSEILQKILSIKDDYWVFHSQGDTTLKNYDLQFNYFDAKVFISCEVYEENLNKGKELTPLTKSMACGSGLGAEGDEACLFIPQILGGDGNWRNAFPLNPNMNRGKWVEDEVKVFDHILNGKNRHAKLLIAADYPVMEDEDSPYANRPLKIYWYFELFENGDVFGEPLEGIFENKLPEE
jgi:hypothetical protein